MAKYSPAETTEWVANNLRQVKHVSGVELLSEQILRVSRAHYGPFVAGVVSLSRVDTHDIQSIVGSEFDVEFIANVPKEAFWTGGALKLAQNNEIATGSLGDLYRVIGVQNVREFQSRETEFIERGLQQHDRVMDFDRIHDRLYRISREGLPDLTVVMLNEYELTADHLRTARDRYGKYSLAVITNPYGRATSAAEEAAEAIGAEILKWGPFLGRLNKK